MAKRLGFAQTGGPRSFGGNGSIAESAKSRYAKINKSNEADNTAYLESLYFCKNLSWLQGI
jgi:hypothetical protein